MAIRIDLQRASDMDEGIDYPAWAWFAAVPRVGEVIQFRAGHDNMLKPHTVRGVNYVENEPNVFQVLVVVD